jgi:hypothetical protein
VAENHNPNTQYDIRPEPQTLDFLPFQLYCTPSCVTITTGGNANGGSAAVTDLRTVTIFRFEHLGIRVLNPSVQFTLSAPNGLRTGLFRIPASAGTSLPLPRHGTFAFRASRKGAFYQQKCQAKACWQRPITTLYYTFHPETLIKKSPFRRKFGPKRNPHNDPKIPILLIEKDLTPPGAPENTTGTLESFTEKSTATLQNFPKNPAGASENPCHTSESFPESLTEAPEKSRSRPRNPHLSRKTRRKKILD